MKETLVHFPWPWLSVLGMFIFLGFFIGLVVLVSLRSQQPKFFAASQLPLDEGVKHE